MGAEVVNTSGAGKDEERRAESAVTAGTGTGAGTGAGGSGGRTTGTVQTKKISQVATVTKPKTLPKGSPPKEVSVKKTEDGATEIKEVKPNRPRKKQVKQSDVNAQQITALITSLSAVVASRPDMAHWLITPEEAKTIAEPLSNIIEKSEKLSEVSKYSDHIALVIACTAITLPRVMVTLDKQKKKKAVKMLTPEGKEEKASGKRNEKRSSDESSKTLHRSDAAHGQSLSPHAIDISPIATGY